MNKHDLKQYLRIKKELSAKIMVRKELRSVMDGLKAQQITDMPKSHSNRNALEEIVIRIDDIDMDIVSMYQQLEAALRSIESAVKTLQDPVERSIIELHYIVGLTWEKVAVEIGYSWTQTHEYHGKALEHLKSE